MIRKIVDRDAEYSGRIKLHDFSHVEGNFAYPTYKCTKCGIYAYDRCKNNIYILYYHPEFDKNKAIGCLGTEGQGHLFKQEKSTYFFVYRISYKEDDASRLFKTGSGYSSNLADGFIYSEIDNVVKMAYKICIEECTDVRIDEIKCSSIGMGNYTVTHLDKEDIQEYISGKVL